jgi:uncharacterized phosphosugar-binding protein
MTDNVIKSEDLNNKEEKPVKKAAPKKAAAPKKEAKAVETVQGDNVIIVFECGASYTSQDVTFTRDNHIQEVSAEIASRLLELENFRIADPFEIEDFLKNKEG